MSSSIMEPASVPLILIEFFLIAHLQNVDISATINVKKMDPTNFTYIHYLPKLRRRFKARLLTATIRLTIEAVQVFKKLEKTSKYIRKGTTATTFIIPGRTRQPVEPIFTTLRVLTRRAICTAFTLEVTPELIPLVKTRYTTEEENLKSTTLSAAHLAMNPGTYGSRTPSPTRT